MNRCNIIYLLKKAFAKREDLFNNSNTNCFRLFNTEGIDGLTVDLYGEYILVQYFNESLKEKDMDILRSLQESVLILPVAVKGILLKDRIKHIGKKNITVKRRSILVEGIMPPDGYTVCQNGILASVDLIRGQSSGIFLDMRSVRDKLVDFYSKFHEMLNLFCYTALFSVHALKNGVMRSINIDLSKSVLKRAKSNYSLNGIRYDDRDFVYGDSIEWIRIFNRKKNKFSFIIFDPPTFSRNKKRTFSAKKNYKESLLLLKGLVEEGYILTSVNSPAISMEEYMAYHPNDWEMAMFENESSDFVHSGSPYLKVGLWKIKKS